VSETINLRTVRKRRAREAERAAAAARAAAAGEGKVVRRLRAAEEAQAGRRLDGHRVETKRPPDVET
jgi:hypothetical protein